MEVKMAGEVNLNKLKEVAKKYYANNANKVKTAKHWTYSPVAIMLVHEYINDTPDKLLTEDVTCYTGYSFERNGE
jgi:hypothetical protein